MLCAEMLEDDLRAAPEIAALLRTLRCPAGGYRTLPGESDAQTNATAAAMAVFTMLEIHGDFLREDAGVFAGFSGRTADGRAPDGAGKRSPLDLYSAADAGGHGRDGGSPLTGHCPFIKRMAGSERGFRACAGDDAPDLEYTYYGIAALAVLRAQLAALASWSIHTGFPVICALLVHESAYLLQ